MNLCRVRAGLGGGVMTVSIYAMACKVRILRWMAASWHVSPAVSSQSCLIRPQPLSLTKLFVHVLWFIVLGIT